MNWLHDDGFPRPFGDYTLLSALGQGGMGVVFLARDVGGAPCVVKTLRPDFNETDALGRFIDEARLSIELKHENICEVLEVGEEDGHVFIALRYLGRLPLRKLHNIARKQKKPLDVQLAIWIVCEVLKGLHYAHTLKDPSGVPLRVVHRDISPQNVMITTEGEVKIIDFGLAFSTTKTEQTEVGTTQGKIQYMAPEQVKAQAADHRADQFAVAMLTYELVVGERFYEELEGIHKIWRIAGGGFRPRKWEVFEQLYPELASSVDIALSERPADRWPDCEAFGASLRSAAASLGAAQDGRALKAFVGELFPNFEEEEAGFLHSLGIDTQKAPDTATRVIRIDHVTPVVEQTARIERDPPSRAPVLALFALVVAALLGGIAWIALKDDDRSAPDAGPSVLVVHDAGAAKVVAEPKRDAGPVKTVEVKPDAGTKTAVTDRRRRRRRGTVKDPVVEDPVVEDPVVGDPVVEDPTSIHARLKRCNKSCAKGFLGMVKDMPERAIPKATVGLIEICLRECQ